MASVYISVDAKSVCDGKFVFICDVRVVTKHVTKDDAR